MKLYEITREFKEVEGITDVPECAVRDTLEAISGEFKDKALAVTAFIKNQDADIETLKAHSKVIADKIRVISNKNDSMREYLRLNMEACGISKIESPYFNITLGKPSEVVEVEDITLIPKRFIKTAVSADKAAIKKQIKSGAEVLGAKISMGKSRLLIK